MPPATFCRYEKWIERACAFSNSGIINESTGRPTMALSISELVLIPTTAAAW
jgi:hypothetical protein